MGDQHIAACANGSLLGQAAHDGSALYVPNSEPALGETVPVFVRAPAGVRGVRVRTTPDGEPHYVSAEVDRQENGDTWWRAEVHLRNPLTGYRFQLDTADGPQWLTAAGVVDYDVPDATDFRLLAYDAPPRWAADAIVYEIFPDRFARSALAAARAQPDWAVPCHWDDPVIGRGPETPYQFYGGDLDGITEHLDHIERLGANTVYLTPIFPAPSNHRYDAAAFDRVDPLLGGDEALARLAAALHQRGMRLVGDLTTNHCGATHPWFTAAADGGPEREMFYCGHNGGFESWLGVETLPKLNWGSPELRRRFLDGASSVARRWLEPPYGLDGWRVDVANMTGRRAADAYTWEVARELRRAVAASRADALLVAEHAHDASGDLDRDGWQGTMNYAGFTRPLWAWLGAEPVSATRVVATMRAFASLVSWRTSASNWNLLGSHDTARVRTVIEDDGRLEVAVGLLATMPGVPMVFAGDELGLTGVNGEDARRTMPWHRPDRWDHALLGRYRELLAVRGSSPALTSGGLRWAYVDDDTLCFLREAPAERMLVLARRAPGAPVRLAGVGAVEAENLYGGAPASPDPDGSVTLTGDGPTMQIWRLR